MKAIKFISFKILCLFFFCQLQAQQFQDVSLLTVDRIFSSEEFRQERLEPIVWIDEGEAYIIIEPSSTVENAYDLVSYEARSQKRSIFITADQLIPEGETEPLSVEEFSLSQDRSKLLIFTNTRKVWRSNTKGDYWLFDLTSKKLKKLGNQFPEASLMFAKFSPDSKSIAYVSGFNLFVEGPQTGKITQLTFDGNEDIINGTFDWVYEEEFSCRDGFRWNVTGTHIAFWQLNASEIRDFYMINNIDSVYSKIIPVQYPKVGTAPSACKVGIVNILNKDIRWISIPGGEKENYIPRMQWVGKDELLIQQINRKQNHLIIWKFNTHSKDLVKVYEEKDSTWVDIFPMDISSEFNMEDLPLVENNSAFIRLSEVGGWRHYYKVNIESGEKELLTPGAYDIASTYRVVDNSVYFSASPTNSTQRYLYKISTIGNDTTRLTPANYQGLNFYNISPNGKYAIHEHSNTESPSTIQLISLSDHKVIKVLVDNAAYREKVKKLSLPKVEMFTVKTADGVEMDGKLIKPIDFDAKKKYPVLFYVYGEPADQVATDTWENLWHVMIAQQGYVVITIDNRGTPSLKGREWRKSIYRKIGVINSRDQAMAAQEILKWNFIDPERLAVWGWSGGGSLTLNLLFRYPEIYKTGMAVAPVSYQLNYDNIYQERYMGLPSENKEDFIEGSPITYAKNLQGNLLLVHGTADDNVHYQNTEMLINELIKYNKQFHVMPYPNRSHGIYEGENTRKHLFTLLTNFLKAHVPYGGR